MVDVASKTHLAIFIQKKLVEKKGLKKHKKQFNKTLDVSQRTDEKKVLNKMEQIQNEIKKSERKRNELFDKGKKLMN